jgi:hypothetical protein
MSLARTVSDSETLRKVAIPAYRAYARMMVFNKGPRVLANSMPKSGTHLLSNVLKYVPDMMFSGRHHTFHHFELPGAPPYTEQHGLGQLDWDRLERTLMSVRKGQFMTAHFSFDSRLASLLEELDYKLITMLRDPRDVAVSSAFYISRSKRHFLHERFNTELESFGARLMASITGLPPTAERRGLGSIGQRIARYKPWFASSNVYICRFEHLVGARGGGNTELQRRELQAIGAHIERPLSDMECDAVADSAWSTRSSTFRRGAVGDWRNHFTEDHKVAFKEVAGAELIALGYEQDDDW